MFLGFSLYLVWEMAIFLKYDQLRKTEAQKSARDGTDELGETF
jgi:hypothetical protein